MITPDRPAVSIIVPTFREAENLRLLTARVFAALDAADLAGELIIVDDDSRDGTAAIAAELAQARPVRLVTRQGERGLSSAVLRGFEEACHDVLVVMDADLSHPPERIPALVRPILDRTADMVVGSRYVEGGRTIEWSFVRKVNSLAATWLARPLTSLRDPMAGFFCLHRDTWKRAEQLNPIGYKIGLELVVKARCKNVLEVPIEFSDRLHGRSKLTMRQQLLYLRHLARLYAFRWPSFRLIALLGAVAALVWLAALLLRA